MFIADPRTERAIGEPKSNNPAIIQSSLYIGMHLQTVSTQPKRYLDEAELLTHAIFISLSLSTRTRFL